MTSIVTFIQKAALVAAYAAIIVAGVSFGVPRYNKLTRLKAQNANLKEAVEQREQAVRKLKQNQERMQWDPYFVELILHQNNRIRPGEIVFHFIEPDAP